MKNVRFYLEYPNPTEKNKSTRKKPGNHTGNVFAVYTDIKPQRENLGDRWGWVQEGVGAVFFRPNSPVALTSASLDFLATHCLRISEEQAREIHPELFKRLDEDNKEE